MRSKSQILSKLRADGHITDEEYKSLEQKLCGDCIRREDALMALTGAWTEPTDEIIHRFIRRIKALPSVNLQEPKTGHWVDKKCSVCGCKSMLGLCIENYCANCGCRIFEPQERSE